MVGRNIAFRRERSKIELIRTTKPIAKGVMGEEKKRFDEAAATPIGKILSSTELMTRQISFLTFYFE